MKNFLNQLATNLYLKINVNGMPRYAGLQDCLSFNADENVFVDGIEILPKYRHLSVDNKLLINEPFYCWYHRISGQGWLLKPH